MENSNIDSIEAEFHSGAIVTGRAAKKAVPFEISAPQVN